MGVNHMPTIAYNSINMVPVSAQDAFLIQNSINEMLQCMDLGTEEAALRFANQFTTEGKLHIELTKVTKTGRNELVGLCKFLHEKFSKCTHWEGNVVLTTGNGAIVKNRSYWKALEGGDVISVGIHEDEFVQEQGEWKCRSRIVKHVWTKAGGHIKQKCSLEKCS